MKSWRFIMQAMREPIWPFCVASLSMSPVPIPLPPPRETASAHGRPARPAGRFLNKNRNNRILARLSARGA